MAEATPAKNKNDNLKWWILATVILGTFLGRLDQTIVNLALPKIITDFSITVDSAGWIATAYIIANAIFVPVWGKLGDTAGRKKVYISGFVIFIVGSVLAGLSWNLTSMIIFRVIQAIASSADYPTAMAILAVTFKEGKERAQALGFWSASFAVASVFGPLIGGPLIDTFGWRSVFLVNLPVGLVGLLMAIIFVEESTSLVKDESFDWFGASSLGIFLASIVLVLDQGSGWGWLSLPIILWYLIALISGVAFYFIEKYQKAPIVDFKFFSNTLFVGTLVNNFVTFMGLMGSVFLIPIFSQTFLGYTATQSGDLFIPMALIFLVAAPLGGTFIGKIKSQYIIFVSTFIGAAGLFFLVRIDPRSTAIDIMWPICVMAFGMGFGMAQRTNAIAVSVPQNEIGVASSILALVRNIAGAFGIAIFASLLNVFTDNNVIKISQFSTFNFQSATDFKTAIGLIILKADVSAYSEVFFIAATLMLIGSFTAFMIRTGHQFSDVEMFVE